MGIVYSYLQAWTKYCTTQFAENLLISNIQAIIKYLFLYPQEYSIETVSLCFSFALCLPHVPRLKILFLLRFR